MQFFHCGAKVEFEETRLLVFLKITVFDNTCRLKYDQ